MKTLLQVSQVLGTGNKRYSLFNYMYNDLTSQMYLKIKWHNAHLAVARTYLRIPSRHRQIGSHAEHRTTLLPSHSPIYACFLIPVIWSIIVTISFIYHVLLGNGSQNLQLKIRNPHFMMNRGFGCSFNRTRSYLFAEESVIIAHLHHVTPR